MRIIAGKYKGRVLSGLGKGDTRAHLRPTSDKVRESIFNFLTHGVLGDCITDARVLDLCAGTGALGLESLSRGAEFALFIDNGAKSRETLHRNIKMLDVENTTQIIPRDVIRLGMATTAPFDLIFFDPPYGKNMGAVVLPQLLSGGWMNAGATILWEEGAAHSAPAGFIMCDTRIYGQTWVHVLQPTQT